MNPILEICYLNWKKKKSFAQMSLIFVLSLHVSANDLVLISECLLQAGASIAATEQRQ